MARIFYPDCKRQINETNKHCSKCGYKFAREETVKAKEKRQGVQIFCVILIALGLGVAFMIIWGIIQNNSRTPSSYQEASSSYQDSLEAKRHLVNCPSIYKTGVSCSHVGYQRDVKDYKYYWKFPKGDPRRLKDFDSEIARIKSIEMPHERRAREARQRARAWVGTWSLDSTGGIPTKRSIEKRFRASDLNDTFIAWIWTFSPYGVFVSHLTQNTDTGTMTTTVNGDYKVYDDRYMYRATRAHVSVGSTKLPVSVGKVPQRGTWSIKGDTLTLTPDDGSGPKVFSSQIR